MSTPAAFVSIDLAGAVRPVGRLWAIRTRGSERAAFEFDHRWLVDPVHFALGSALPPSAGTIHSGEGRALFGALGDSAPDRWGRTLITRNEARRARAAGQTPRTLREVDFLLGVSDLTRQGALRFALAPDGPFVAEADANQVPPLVGLGDLLAAAQAIEDDTDAVETDNAVRRLLAPGSSLGGARPKASVRDRDGSLAIAKFPLKSDSVDMVRWEAVMLALAERAGISVPDARIEHVGNAAILLSRRFDRRGEIRVPFLSAMSLLDARDGDRGSYVEMSDALRRVASTASSDLPQLWRRLAFNILASNFDDHLRNHAVLYDGNGWRLSPAYDLNPVPLHVKPRELATAINIDGDPTASIELAVEAASEFLLAPVEAKRIAADVASHVAAWRTTATQAGIGAAEIDAMASAFEHADATRASTWR